MRTAPHRGFTLLEVLLSLVILAALGVLVFSSLTMGARGFMSTRADTATTQRARLALTRMTIELRRLIAVSSAGDDSISFTTPQGAQTLTRSGSTITLNNNLLIENLASSSAGSPLFVYRRSDGSTAWTAGDDLKLLYEIVVTLPLGRPRDPVGGGITHVFTAVVNPRNTGAANFP